MQKQPLNKFYKKVVLNHFPIFTGKHLCWSLFIIKLQAFMPASFLKRDSNADVFLWILRYVFLQNIYFQERLPFYISVQLLMILKLMILRNFTMILWTSTCDSWNHLNYGHKKRENLFSCDQTLTFIQFTAL